MVMMLNDEALYLYYIQSIYNLYILYLLRIYMELFLWFAARSRNSQCFYFYFWKKNIFVLNFYSMDYIEYVFKNKIKILLLLWL